MKQKRVEISKIHTDDDVADIMTKNLDVKSFEKHKKALGMYARPKPEGKEVSTASRSMPAGLRQMAGGLKACLSGILMMVEQIEGYEVQLYQKEYRSEERFKITVDLRLVMRIMAVGVVYDIYSH